MKRIVMYPKVKTDPAHVPLKQPRPGYNCRGARRVTMARKVYSQEFRRAAVEQVIAQRHPARCVAQRLGVGYTLRFG